MARFAAVLEDLVETRGLTNVRWVTVAERAEHGGAALTLDAVQGALPGARTRSSSRAACASTIKLMGGDLIESAGARCHTIWWEYMAHNMNDILDAYSVHIYWNYWDIPRMEFRLKDVRRIVTQEIAPSCAEADLRDGVRRPWGQQLRGQADVTAAYWEDGTELAKDEHRGVPAALVQHRLRPARLLGGVEVGRVLGRLRQHPSNQSTG